MSLLVVGLTSRLSAQTFNATGGNQTSMITGTGTLTITARGADGATTFADGGSGATVTADFPVQMGDELIIVAGVAGVGNISGQGFGGGGGGSAVILKRGGNSTLLIVAGGGGGSSLLNSNGKGASSADGTAGGGTSPAATGGGGFGASGSNITVSIPFLGSVLAYTGGQAGTLTGGGAGGSPQIGPFAGGPSGGFGFGGGGSGNSVLLSGGGGGGYSGGTGGSPSAGGNGGTSFVQNSGIVGTNITRVDGVTGGGTKQDGSIILDFVCGAPAPNLLTSDEANQPVPSGQTSVAVCQNAGNVTFESDNCVGGTVNWTGSDNSSGTGNIIAPTTNVGTVTYSATCTLDGCTGEASEVSVTTTAPPTLSISGKTSVILGFGSNCTTLTANAGGTGQLSYSWMQGQTEIGTDAELQVCPEATTTYSVTVTDANGCTTTKEVTVSVQDVRCGPKKNLVTVCYYGVTQCVSEKIAQRYLKLGATLGACGSGNARIGVEEIVANAPLQLSVKAFPNPVQDAVTLEVLAPTAGVATFQVVDMAGKARQTRQENLVEGLNEIEFRLGTLPTGLYLIRTVDALNRQGVVKVSKQ